MSAGAHVVALLTVKIALHIPSPVEQAHAAELLRRRGMRVSWYIDGAALCAGIAAGTAPDAVVTTMRDAQGRSLAPLIRQLRTRFPAVPVVVYGILSPYVAGDIAEAAHLGVADAALHGYDDLAAVLARVTSATAARSVAEAALAALNGRLAPATLPVVRYCLANAHTVPTVVQIAAALGVSRKTMSARLAADGLPPASALVSWGRLLLAARWLEDAGCSIERVALALGFESGTGLRHMLVRYTGLRTNEVRVRGGLAGVLPLFVGALGDTRERDRRAG